MRKEKGVKYDANKLALHLIPVSTFRALGTVLGCGAKKYKERNWEKGVAYSRYYAAAMRHITAWWGGEDKDPETGFPHLWHAQCCLAFLTEYLQTHPELDDRPNKTRLERNNRGKKTASRI